MQPTSGIPSAATAQSDRRSALDRGSGRVDAAVDDADERDRRRPHQHVATELDTVRYRSTP